MKSSSICVRVCERKGGQTDTILLTPNGGPSNTPQGLVFCSVVDDSTSGPGHVVGISGSVQDLAVNNRDTRAYTKMLYF